MQSVDIIKYTDEEYEKYLTDPVGTLSSFVFITLELIQLLFGFSLWKRIHLMLVAHDFICCLAFQILLS